MTGVTLSGVAAVADSIVGAVRTAEFSIWRTLLGCLQSIALFFPGLVLLSLALALLHRFLASTPWLAGIRTKMNWSALKRPDPEASAALLAILVTVASFAAGTRTLAHHFSTQYHDPGLAATAMTATTLVWVLACGLTLLVLRDGLARILSALPFNPNLAAIGFLVLGVGLGVTIFAFVHWFEVVRNYIAEIAWASGITLSYVLLRWLLRRRKFPRRTVMIVVGLGVAGIVVNAFTFDRTISRAFIEHDTSLGLPLLRIASALTDFDNDGYSIAFGGGDCNDLDDTIYPGAADPPGDGIDADCFDGDGANVDGLELTDGSFGERPAQAPRRPNILLISVDTLRPDHLGCYGYERETSPNIDRFCEEAVVFETPVAASSRSLRSIPAMFTGLYPSQVAFGSAFVWPAVLDENHLVAEVFRENGYRTSAVVGTDYFARVPNFYQGFATIEQARQYKPPRPWAVEHALRHLNSETGAPRFTWVHLFNVHGPYLHDRTPSRFGDERADAYDTEILLADQEIGRLIDALDSSPAADETYVVIVSDHGESLGDNGRWGHARSVYASELQSVFMIRGPGLEPRRVTGWVSLVDLFPTLLNLADLPLPNPVAGRSLLPIMVGEDTLEADRRIFAEMLPDGEFAFDLKTIYQDTYKLIWSPRDGSVRLFDLVDDPSESRDVSLEQPEVRNDLFRSMRAWVSQLALASNRSADAVRDARLESLPDFEYPLDLEYPGRFRIAGYDMNARTLSPGDTLQVVFYIEVLAAMEEDLRIDFEMEDQAGHRLIPTFHGAHIPVGGAYHTHQWRAGEILRDEVRIIVPPSPRIPLSLSARVSVRDPRPRAQPIVGFINGREGTVFEMGQLELTAVPR